MYSNKKKIIIDCDPGIDDAFALLYAFKDPNFSVELITTVSGNVNVNKTTRNALGLVRLAEQDIKVVKGSSRPLVGKPKFAEDVHGISGLGTYEFQDIDIKTHEKDNVVKELYNTIMESPEKVYMVTIGPLTNIAKVLLLYPEIKNNIEAISLMGGGIKGGNFNMASEFNVYVDPEATKIVFDSGIPIIMSGLDVTEKALFFPEHLDKVSKIPKIGSFIKEIVESNPMPKKDGSLLQLNDVLALMVLTNPEIFSIKDFFVDVELTGDFTRGWTLADQRRFGRKSSNINVVYDLKYDDFIDLLMERLQRYE